MNIGRRRLVENPISLATGVEKYAEGVGKDFRFAPDAPASSSRRTGAGVGSFYVKKPARLYRILT
jgi:hypothetical protein